MKLDENTKNGVFKEYVKGVLKNEYAKDILEATTVNIQMLEDNEVVNVIPTNKLDYLLLVTKLEALLNIIDVIHADDNVVFSDDFKNESENFKDKVTQAIIKSVVDAKETLEDD